MPGLAMLRSYRPALFGKDLVAGLVLTTLLVPQGMAYAELAGLPAITGLYTTILALLGYALFGPSRVLVLGPDSSLGPMIAAVVVPLVAAEGDAEAAVAYASVLALMVGAITVLSGVFNLGFIADLSPLQEWGIEVEKRHMVVAPSMQTSMERVFAAGDITEYPGKVRLIAVGFGEAATAVNNAAVAIDPSAHVFPGHSSEGS